MVKALADSRFFAALVGINGGRLDFFDVQQALSTQTGRRDLFAGVGVGLDLGHAKHFFIGVGHGITKACGHCRWC